MPSPEIANPVALPFAEAPEITAPRVQPGKKTNKYYLKSVILLVAVYALIINRSADARRTFQHTLPPPTELIKPEPANAFVHNTKHASQNALVFTSGMPVIFYSPYLLWK